MILHCPGCRVKLRVPDSHLENQKEIWVKCPKCGERFRPQSLNLDSELGRVTGSPGPAHEKSVTDILNRMQLDQMSPRSSEDFERVLDALPVIPETPPHTKILLGITISLVFALFFALILIFRASQAPPLETPPPTPPIMADYGKDLLLSDFLALRKDILRFQQLDRYINYRGRESRVYKYFIPLLAPDSCQEVTQLRMWSFRTSDGLKIGGECLEPMGVAAILDIRWNFNNAVISVEGKPQSAVELPLPRLP